MQVIRLCKGTGEEGKSHCVMAATSIVSGEEFSDSPSCVCPAITRALIIINDRCPSDAIRERLLGHLPWLIIGTRSADLAVSVRRAQMFAEYADAADAAAAAAAYAADAAWEASMKGFIDFIENEIIPVHTTMPIEKDYSGLVVREVVA